jgi:phosphomannomutase
MERQVSVTLPGAAGMDRMRSIMAVLRKQPPTSLGSLPVVRIRDYDALTISSPGSPPMPFAGARGDLVMFDLGGTAAEAGSGRLPAIGNCVAARPSGTEPKIKFYLFGKHTPGGDLSADKVSVKAGLDSLWSWIEADAAKR